MREPIDALGLPGPRRAPAGDWKGAIRSHDRASVTPCDMPCATDRGDRIRNAGLAQRQPVRQQSALWPLSRRRTVIIGRRLCSSSSRSPGRSAMFRVAVARTTAMGLARSTPALSARVVLPRLSPIVRYKSSKISPIEKQQLEAQDDLRRDWDARILSYEELKPKTQQPSPVSRAHVLSSL